MTHPFEKRWLIGSAEELAVARAWLKARIPEDSWQLDLLGLEEDTSAQGGARIAVRAAFADEQQARAFVDGFLRGTSEAVQLVPPPPPPETESDSGFAEGARRILEGPEPISAGKLHFLELDKVQAHFGDQWPKLASRAEALVRRAIERRLSPQDVYRKTADLNFVVLFANLSSREADLKCTLIAEEITRMLVGEEMGGGMLAVKTAATEVDGPETLRRVGASMDIAQAVETEVEVERLRREAPPPDTHQMEAPGDPLEGIQFLYRPIWDVRRSAVANFCLVPAKRVAGGRWRHGDAEILGLEDPEVRRRFDLLLLERAMADLEALHRQGRRLAISVPVHFESISVATRRTAYVARWRALPAECRKLGVFEIVGCPDGVPQGRMAEIANHLRLDSRGVLVRVPLATATHRNFSDTGVDAVGTELGSQIMTEERLMAAFRDFVANAERARLPAYIHGLRSFSLTIGAIGAGFAYVDGDPVSSVSEQPADAFRFGLDDLYAKRLGS